MDDKHMKEKRAAQHADHMKQAELNMKDDSFENQNKDHNTRKETPGPNTYRKR